MLNILKRSIDHALIPFGDSLTNLIFWSTTFTLSSKYNFKWNSFLGPLKIKITHFMSQNIYKPFKMLNIQRDQSFITLPIQP